MKLTIKKSNKSLALKKELAQKIVEKIKVYE